MTTPEIYIVEPSTSEEAKALKAFAKSLKMKITRQNTKSTNSTEDVETSLVQYPADQVHLVGLNNYSKV